MDGASMHPNLARIAAAYDQICEAFAAGLIDADMAQDRIRALAARDDNGVVWTIDPATGDWLYRTVDGQLVVGTPPMYGFATPNAHDVTRNSVVANPSDRLTHIAVDDSLTPPGALAGSTRPVPLAITEASMRSRVGRSLLTKVVIAVAAAALAVWGWATFIDTDTSPTAPPAPEKSIDVPSGKPSNKPTDKSTDK